MGKMKQLLDDEVFDEPRGETWPFPQYPLPTPKNNNPPKFNPNNHEDSPMITLALTMWAIDIFVLEGI